MTCDLDRVDALADGRLDGPEAKEVMEHLAGCPQCRAYYEGALAADRVHRHFFNGGVLTPERARELYLRRKNEIDQAVIGMCTTVSVHARGGSAAVTQFLEAYTRGLLAKIVFLGVLASLLPRLGAGLPWLLAAVSGIVVMLALPLLRLGSGNRPDVVLAAPPASPRL